MGRLKGRTSVRARRSLPGLGQCHIGQGRGGWQPPPWHPRTSDLLGGMLAGSRIGKGAVSSPVLNPVLLSH